MNLDEFSLRSEACVTALRETLSAYPEIKCAVILLVADGVAEDSRETERLSITTHGDRGKVEALCSWGYGISAGLRMQYLDEVKASGIEHGKTRARNK